MPNMVVMNSLVSATKVITNDTIPNPIVSSMTMPSIPVPVSSLGIPVINMKTDDDDDFVKPARSPSINDIEEKMEEKPLSDVECNDGEHDKLSETKGCDSEPMPVEVDDDKVDGNCCENDIDVNDDSKVAANDNSHVNNKLTGEILNSAEPMECASVASFASPRHTMTTDVVMAESVSV